MKLIKIILDHKNNKVFGQSVTERGLSVQEYIGFSGCTEAQKVVANQSITIYDLRL